MQRTFNRAEEKALLASVTYDLGYVGAPGVSLIATYAQGWQGQVAGIRSDERELNVSFDYRVGRGVFESFWLRLRGSWLQQISAGGDQGEVRVILRYEPPLL